MKIDSYIEAIFSHAVALSQNGRFRNEIYCKGSVVYVVNFDNTVILGFDLPNKSFENEISFEANDYDSNDFYEEDGKIIFKQSSGGFTRKKVCGKTKRTFKDIESLFTCYIKGYFETHKNIVGFHCEALNLLDESLSHIEVLADNKSPILVQRDVYSGSIIRLERDRKGFGFEVDHIEDFVGPIGLRTCDFFALFTFNDEIKFHFSADPSGFVIVKGSNYNMIGVIAKCVYDEMGTVNEVLIKENDKQEESNGREEPKVRRRKSQVDSKTDKGEKRQRTRKRESEPETKTEQPVRRRGIRIV